MKTNVKYQRKHANKQGFTFIEIAIGLVLSALIGTISYNQLLSQRPAMALQDVTWDLMSELRLARATAIAENTRAVINLSNTGLTVEVDSSNDGTITNDERRLVTFSDSDVTITRSQNVRVAFTGSGRFIQSTAAGPLSTEVVTLRHADTRQVWTVTIFSNGQVRLTKI